jgi:hypothetical protein
MYNIVPILHNVNWMTDGMHPSNKGARIIALDVNKHLIGEKQMTPIKFVKESKKINVNLSKASTVVGLTTMQGILNTMLMHTCTKIARLYRKIQNLDEKRVVLGYQN